VAVLGVTKTEEAAVVWLWMEEEDDDTALGGLVLRWGVSEASNEDLCNIESLGTVSETAVELRKVGDVAVASEKTADTLETSDRIFLDG
jgi:hypothetical protein